MDKYIYILWKNIKKLNKNKLGFTVILGIE
jgi:hypothetical protein